MSLPKCRDHLGKPSATPTFIRCGVREIEERGEGQQRALGIDSILPLSNMRDRVPKPMSFIIRVLPQSQTHTTSIGWQGKFHPFWLSSAFWYLSPSWSCPKIIQPKNNQWVKFLAATEHDTGSSVSSGLQRGCSGQVWSQSTSRGLWYAWVKQHWHRMVNKSSSLVGRTKGRKGLELWRGNVDYT